MHPYILGDQLLQEVPIMVEMTGSSSRDLIGPDLLFKAGGSARKLSVEQGRFLTSC